MDNLMTGNDLNMMKEYKLLISITSIILLFNSCEKEELDYRLLYTGDFSFVTISNIRSMCYDTSALCIDGWKDYSFDTGFFVSNVEKYGEKQLEIYFGEGVLGIYNDSTYKQIVYPELLQNGELTLNDFPSGAHNRFEGNYIGYDLIIIKIQFGTLIGGYSIYEVIGTRNDQ